MSLELLVLLAVVVLLPLLQRLLEAARTRVASSAEQARRQSPAPRVPRPRPPTPAPSTLPDTLPRAAPDAGPARTQTSAGGPVSSPDTGGMPIAIVQTSHQSAGRSAVAGLRTRHDLRRAVVLATMLGPCRANSPYGRPEGADGP